MVLRALEHNAAGRILVIENVPPDVALDGADGDLRRQRPAAVGPLQIALLAACRELPLLDTVVLARERVAAVAGDLPGLEIVVHEITDLELPQHQIGKWIRFVIRLFLAEQPIRQTHGRPSIPDSQAGHPASRRYFPVTNTRFAPSSRPVSRVPRPHAPNLSDGTLAGNTLARNSAGRSGGHPTDGVRARA